MIWQNWLRQRVLLVGTTALLTATSLLPVLEASARPLGSPSGNSSAGAVRGACQVAKTAIKNRTLLALSDSNDPTLTVADRPTFWFYVPFSRTKKITSLEFELVDEAQKSVLSSKKIVLALPDQAGIVNFSLPKTEKALEVGKEYFWRLHVICDPKDGSGNPKVTGWVKRTALNPDLAKRLSTTPKSDQYLVYAKSDIWFERITQLAQYRAKYPQAWTTLLKSFQLEEFSQTAIVELRPPGVN